MSEKNDPRQSAAWMPPDEAEAHARETRVTFEQGEISWRDDYDELLAEPWPWYDGPDWNRWRLAAYVAWESTSGVAERWPKNKGDLARLLGWSGPRQFRKYRRRYPEIDRMVRENVLEPLFEQRAAVLTTLTEQAQLRDYKSFRDRELFLKLAGVYQPSQDVTVRQGITADEMAAANRQAATELAEWAPSWDEEPTDE